MKVELSDMNRSVDGKYNLESIDIEMPQVTFSIKHCLSFTMKRVNNFTIKQIVTYNVKPKILIDILKHFLSTLDEETKDRRRNIAITIESDMGTLALIGKRKEMDIIENLFNEKLNR